MSLPALTPSRVDAYLARLALQHERADLPGLQALHRAHLLRVPFHNLWPLAAGGRAVGLPSLDAVVDANTGGVGGTCDRTNPPFAALLRSLGFDAALAAGTVRRAGDHFLCVVTIGGRRWLCDVGNGHPYLRPWALDGGVQEIAHAGWRFRFHPAAPGGPTLRRLGPDGRWRVVYRVDPRPRSYESFAPMVAQHYGQEGFGPFLGALRAARVEADAVVTLRDDRLVRYGPCGRQERCLAGSEALERALRDDFELPRPLVDGALDTLRRRRPELFVAPAWLTEAATPTPACQPPREAVPDLLVTVATVGRYASVQRLLDTLGDELRGSGYPGDVGVLLVENHAPEVAAPLRAPAEVTLHRVPIAACRARLERAAELGLLPPPGERLPVSIGAAREAQLDALRRHLDVPVAGLPHPRRRPVVVWMLDDDVAFSQLARGTDRPARHVALLHRVARLWATFPQHRVLLGTFTGDPPVPGVDCLYSQVRDLCFTAERLLAGRPEAAWQPPAAPPVDADAHYDLSEHPERLPEARYPFGVERAGQPGQEVAAALVAALPRLVDGQQLTRPLQWSAEQDDLLPRPSTRRGGNTVLLDLDALYRWPTPVLRCDDGVESRRGDTLWAELARREEPHAVAEVSLPLLHGREGQGGRRGGAPSQVAARATATGQLRGVAMLRAIQRGASVEEELARRSAAVRVQRRELRAALAHLEALVERLAGWAGLGPAQVAEARDALEALRVGAVDPTDDPSQAAPLQRFVDRLDARVVAWRGSW